MEAVAPDRRLAERYVLVEPIATGGMAAVWRARDDVLARTVAVKVLRPELARDPAFLERFRREAVAAARLTHSCIVSVFDTGMDEDVCYIVMEDVGTTTLRHIMDAEGPLAPDRAVGYVLPVLTALGFAHSTGIVHRDVKPENILIGPEERVKVTDFGLARAAFVGGDLTTTGHVLGSARYLSPEQVQGSDVDGRSDLYSTGVVLYELLTGRPAFEAKGTVATAMMRLTRDPLPPRAVRPGIPRDLDAAVMKAMARRVEERFVSAEAMQSALARHAGASEPAGPRVTLPARPAPPREVPTGRSSLRSWMLVPLVLILVAALSSLAFLVVRRLDGGSSAGPSPGDGGGTGSALQVANVQDFDPEGDDGEEHPEETELAVDGDPATAWSTVRYTTADFGRLKSGLGLFLQFESEVSIRRLVVQSPLPGWTFELKVGRLPDALSDPLQSTGGETSFLVGDDGRVAVDLDPVRAPGVLIWITRLGPDSEKFAAAVGEVAVTGTPA